MLKRAEVSGILAGSLHREMKPGNKIRGGTTLEVSGIPSWSPMQKCKSRELSFLWGTLGVSGILAGSGDRSCVAQRKLKSLLPFLPIASPVHIPENVSVSHQKLKSLLPFLPIACPVYIPGPAPLCLTSSPPW